MIAGKLTERVTLLRPSVTTDAFGAESTDFTPEGVVHAQVTWKTGSLSREVSEFFPTGRIEVVIYDRHPAEAKWRVQYGADLFQVQAVEHVRLRGMKRLYCEKVNL